MSNHATEQPYHNTVKRNGRKHDTTLGNPVLKPLNHFSKELQVGSDVATEILVGKQYLLSFFK